MEPLRIPFHTLVLNSRLSRQVSSRTDRPSPAPERRQFWHRLPLPSLALAQHWPGLALAQPGPGPFGLTPSRANWPRPVWPAPFPFLGKCTNDVPALGVGMGVGVGVGAATFWVGVQAGGHSLEGGAGLGLLFLLWERRGGYLVSGLPFISGYLPDPTTWWA